MNSSDKFNLYSEFDEISIDKNEVSMIDDFIERGYKPYPLNAPNE